MTTIHLCRHGRTEANAAGLLLGRADPDLDDTGRAQAEALAAAIPQPGLVVSSPLARCRRTAEAFGSPVVVDERFAELDYGELDLTPLSEVPADTWRRWRADPGFRPPGGETLIELAGRVGQALDELAAAPEVDGGIAVVTHVSPIKAGLAWALGVGIEVSWRCFVAQAAITEIAVGPTGPSLRSFNQVAHLADLDQRLGGPR